MKALMICVRLALAVAAALVGSALLRLAPAQAQSALCPSSSTDTSGVGHTGLTLSNGTCTNIATAGKGSTGAFSGAALATQALSDLSQSATQETVRNTTSAIATRREEELQRCPDGFSRINGTCERVTPVAAPITPAPRPTAASPRSAVASPRPRAALKTAAPRQRRQVVNRRPPPVVAAEPTPVVYPAPIYQSRFGAWAQGFGNSEDRSAVGQTTIICCTGGGGLPNILSITEKSHADTYGFLGGIDYTARSLIKADDGLILGVLVGYLESDFRIKTSTLSSNVGNVGNGSGTVHANLSGASVGTYATYFSGPFTADLTFKADIFDLNETFNDQLAFTANVDFASFPNTFSGQGSGGLTNLSTFGNLSYRMWTIGPVWVEPTVGFQYTASLFDSRARSELGLDDGDLLMFQGGARVGTDTILANDRKLTTSITGLAYSDVVVSGGSVQGGLFGTNLLSKSDEGEVRGRGILAVNYEMGHGVNLFAQGDVYGGDRLFGAGGKGGLRVQW